MVPYELGNVANSSACSLSGVACTTSPAPVRMSRSSTDSWGSPARQDDASMPRPVTAPPRVMVLSWGTTSGINPYGNVAATRSSYVVMPPTLAVRASTSTESTWRNGEASSQTPVCGLRGAEQVGRLLGQPDLAGRVGLGQGRDGGGDRLVVDGAALGGGRVVGAGAATSGDGALTRQTS